MNTTTLDSADFGSADFDRAELARAELARAGLDNPDVALDTGSRHARPRLASTAARLLAPASDDSRGLKARLSWGLCGLGCLGVAPELALSLAGNAPSLYGSASQSWLLFQGLGLAVGAALSVTLPLPGLLILLGTQDEQAPVSHVLHALGRAYYRLGLLAFGITPILVLYALTGASQNTVTVLCTLCYLAAGGVALTILLRDIYGTLARRRPTSWFLLCGWGCFVAVLGCYFLLKLEQVS